MLSTPCLSFLQFSEVFQHCKAHCSVAVIRHPSLDTSGSYCVVPRCLFSGWIHLSPLAYQHLLLNSTALPPLHEVQHTHVRHW